MHNIPFLHTDSNKVINDRFDELINGLVSYPDWLEEVYIETQKLIAEGLDGFELVCGLFTNLDLGIRYEYFAPNTTCTWVMKVAQGSDRVEVRIDGTPHLNPLIIHHDRDELLDCYDLVLEQIENVVRYKVVKMLSSVPEEDIHTMKHITVLELTPKKFLMRTHVPGVKHNQRFEAEITEEVFLAFESAFKDNVEEY